jgi:hypothetical protein
MFEQDLSAAISPYVPDFLETHAEMVIRAMLSLPFAAVCGAVLAFRPRARGTPPRSASVIQTQIVLAVVGSVVMLIVGSNLARAFGIVGVASLIRYRAKIDDPKDATVMLASLSLGLACGVELYGLAVFATLFTLAVLWIVESLEPERRKTFELKVIAPEPVALRARIESMLRQNDIQYELRSLGGKEIVFEAQLPLRISTDRIANAILASGPEGETEVVWEEKKKK